MSLLMLQFLVCIVHILDVNKLTIEADTYLLEGLTRCSLEQLSKTFDMMLQQERVKQFSSILSMV